MRLAVMANSDVDGDAPSDLPARGQRVSERSAGCGVGAAGAVASVEPGTRDFAQPALAASATTTVARHESVLITARPSRQERVLPAARCVRRLIASAG